MRVYAYILYTTCDLGLCGYGVPTQGQVLLRYLSRESGARVEPEACGFERNLCRMNTDLHPKKCILVHKMHVNPLALLDAGVQERELLENGDVLRITVLCYHLNA